MTEKYFDKAYGLDSQEKVDKLYKDWADSYDEEVCGYGYASPARCAEALKNFLPLDAPILDFGCGTGLSGVALQNKGFLKAFLICAFLLVVGNALAGFGGMTFYLVQFVMQSFSN